MPLYRIDVEVAATAYIVADNEADALEMARTQFTQTGGELPLGDVADGVVIDGGEFNPTMPEVSLSPAVTFVKLHGDRMELVEEWPNDGEDA